MSRVGLEQKHTVLEVQPGELIFNVLNKALDLIKRHEAITVEFDFNSARLVVDRNSTENSVIVDFDQQRRRR